MNSSNLDLLIVNPHHAEFYYVPAGSFAIARFLVDHGYRVRIINLAVATQRNAKALLVEAIAKYRPKHIGVVLHWKETLHGAMTAAAEARRLSPTSPIWVGGITAGVYASELLASADYINGVIRGDAEIPLLNILQGGDPYETPNVVSRKRSRGAQPREPWVADDAFLDNLTYGDLSLIDQLPDYLALLDTRLGVPLAGSRGCWHDCGYCGGSRSAFRLHSGRDLVGQRQPVRLVDDLALAYSHGARAFLVSQPAKRCGQVLDEVRHRYGTELDFTLHLEPWEVPSQELLAHYAELTFDDGQTTPQLLLSVHGAQSIERRAKERDEILSAARAILKLTKNIQVTIFDGYFCRWQQNEGELDEALAFVLRSRREFANKRVSVALMAYSTDPESLWSRDGTAFSTSLGLSSISRGVLNTESTADNLLLSRPVGLSERAARHFTATLDVNERLYRLAPLLWFALLVSRGEQRLIALLRDIALSIYAFEGSRAYPTGPSDLFNLTILTAIENRLHHEAQDDKDRPAKFVAELASLLRAARQAQLPSSVRSAKLQSGDDILVFDERSVHESCFSFDRLFSSWRKKVRIEQRDLVPRATEKGHFFYTLRPMIGGALPIQELALLQSFDGISPSSTVITALASDLGAPIAAVRARLSDLIAAGTVRPI